MKQPLAFSFCLLFFHVALCQRYYSSIIVVHPSVYKSVKPAIDDLQLQLTKSTRVKFNIIKSVSLYKTGIQILKLDPIKDSIFDKRLNPLNGDNFLLISNGKTNLKIISYTKQGLINGVYTFLDTLGFRWYHPGELWARIPKLKDVRLKCNNLFVPDFELRSFFGTWGVPRNQIVDKTNYVNVQWWMWTYRNRFGGNYNLAGHSWNEFLWSNINELKHHPEYMALVKGHRVVPTTAAKFCISDTGFQKLFMSYCLEKLMKLMKSSPAKSKFIISVEPSDGEGDCECDKCKKLGSVSNRVFFLANLVAKEFQKVSDKAYVNLYAYNTHAAPPDFALEPNVIVQVIPYKYQSYTVPELMIKNWKAKSDNLFIYDYYGLPILNVDMPLKGALRPIEYSKRINYWHQQHIKGVTLETSYSIGATGIGLYLFSRSLWNTNLNTVKLLSEYYKFCYGKAAIAVKQAQEVLQGDSMQSRPALAKAIHLLNKGSAHLSLDSLEVQRLLCYKAYLHYLKLLYDVQSCNAQQYPGVCDELMYFTYGIFKRMMVNPVPINEWLKNYSRFPQYANKYWDTFNPAKAGMKYNKVVPWTDEQINSAFENDNSELNK